MKVNRKHRLRKHRPSMATLLENEINSTGDITGQTAHVQQIMFSLKDKKCRVFNDIFGMWMNKQSKKVKLCVI